MPNIMIVADSPTDRVALRQALAIDPTLRVVAEVGDTDTALAQLDRLDIDLIVIDLLLARDDGLSAARRIMHHKPTPIVVVTGTDASDPDLLIEVIDAGALDLVAKPAAAGSERYAHGCRQLARMVRALAEVPVVTRREPRPARPGVASIHASLPRPALPLRETAILIGASTGGPPIIRDILASLVVPFPLPILIVQHIAEGFCTSMASWLSSCTGHEVEVCNYEQGLAPGQVLLAPDNRHLRVLPGWRVGPSAGARRGFQRPAVDELFESGAEQLQAAAIGVLLTGMGHDGVAGLGALQRAGAMTLVQAPSSCSVAGMPQLAIDRGYAAQVMCPTDIATTLSELARTPARATLRPPTDHHEERHV